jgi:hypothetical protein
MKSSRPEESGRGWTSGVSWPSTCTSSRVRHLRDVRLDACSSSRISENPALEVSGARSSGEIDATRSSRCFSTSSRVSRMATPRRAMISRPTGSGGGLEAGGLSADFAEGEGEGDSDDGVGGIRGRVIRN